MTYEVICQIWSSEIDKKLIVKLFSLQCSQSCFDGAGDEVSCEYGTNIPRSRKELMHPFPVVAITAADPTGVVQEGKDVLTLLGLIEDLPFDSLIGVFAPVGAIGELGDSPLEIAELELGELNGS